MKRYFLAVVCVVAFIGFAVAATNDDFVELVIEQPEGFTELSVKAKPGSSASVVIMEADGTVVAEWSTGEEGLAKEEIKIDIPFSSIMALDFLTDDERNELIQKYISRKHPGVQVQVEVKK